METRINWKHYHYTREGFFKCSGGRLCVCYGSAEPFDKAGLYFYHPGIASTTLRAGYSLTESIRWLIRQAGYYFLALTQFRKEYFNCVDTHKVNELNEENADCLFLLYDILSPWVGDRDAKLERTKLLNVCDKCRMFLRHYQRVSGDPPVLIYLG